MRLSTLALLGWLVAYASQVSAPAAESADGWPFVYEGHLARNQKPATGSYDFKFQFFSAPVSGLAFGEPASLERIPVEAGMFKVEIPLSGAARETHPLWIEVSVRNETDANEWIVLSPRQKVEAVPFAVRSQSALSVADGTIEARAIAPGAVGPEHLQPGVVRAEHLAKGAALRSMNGIADAVTLAGDGTIQVLTNGNVISLRIQPEVFRPFEVIAPGQKPAFYDDLRQAMNALPDGGELIIRAHAQLSASQVWEGLWPEVAGMAAVGKTNILIRGVNNATITSSTFGDFLYIRNCTNVTIQGLTFEGAGCLPDPTNTMPYAALLNLGGTNQNLTIRDCRFLNFRGHGVSHLWSSKTSRDVRIENCTFEQVGNLEYPLLGMDGAAISGIGANWTVQNNLIRECLRGIEIEGSGPEPMAHIKILNNTIYEAWNEGILIYATSGQSAHFTDILIQGNIVTGKTPVPEKIKFQNGISVPGGERITIAHNQVRGFPKGNCGITVTSVMAEVRDCLITGNIVSDIGFVGIAAYQLSFPCRNVIVANNTVRQSYDGIVASGNGHLLNANIVRLCKNNGIVVHPGQLEKDPSKNVVLTSNISSENEGSGIVVEAAATGTFVQGNVCLDNLKSSILNKGEGTEFISNRAPRQ